MSCFFKNAFHLVSFVKGRIIHNEHTLRGGGRFGIKSFSIQRLKTLVLMLVWNKLTVNKRPPMRAPMVLVLLFAPPVMSSITAFSFRGIAMSARHIVSKSAFIDIDKEASRRLKLLYLLVKCRAFFRDLPLDD